MPRGNQEFDRKNLTQAQNDNMDKNLQASIDKGRAAQGAYQEKHDTAGKKPVRKTNGRWPD